MSCHWHYSQPKHFMSLLVNYTDDGFPSTCLCCLVKSECHGCLCCQVLLSHTVHNTPLRSYWPKVWIIYAAKNIYTHQPEQGKVSNNNLATVQYKGPGIHLVATWCEPPNQTLLQTNYSQSSRTSVGHSKTSPLTSQPVKESAANTLVPDTSGRPQRSCVHALTDQSQVWSTSGHPWIRLISGMS